MNETMNEHDEEEQQQQQQSERNASSSASTKKRPGRKPAVPEPKYPVEPIVLQRIEKPRTFVNHSYRDFSQIPPSSSSTNETIITDIADMTFAQKLFTLLNEPEASRWTTWNSHGRSFRILVPKLLEKSMLLLKYFGHNRYSSFLRQLTNYGFKHITKGVDRNSYYHECFLKGHFHLLQYMPEIKDIRRQIADPENEPDFYEISQRFPVSPGAKKMMKSVGGGVMPSAPTTATPATMNAMNLPLAAASSMAMHEEPLFKRQRLLMDYSLLPPPMIVPSRPSAVSMALAMARPPLHPQEARLQLLRLLQEQQQQQQQQRKEMLLTSLLLRQRHLR